MDTTGELKNLMSDVEDLVARVSDINDPDIVNLRSKVKEALASARDALSSGADRVSRQARQVAGEADDFVRENPWQALGIAALIGVAVGMLVSRRS